MLTAEKILLSLCLIFAANVLSRAKSDPISGRHILEGREQGSNLLPYANYLQYPHKVLQSHNQGNYSVNIKL